MSVAARTYRSRGCCARMHWRVEIEALRTADAPCPQAARLLLAEPSAGGGRRLIVLGTTGGAYRLSRHDLDRDTVHAEQVFAAPQGCARRPAPKSDCDVGAHGPA